MTEELYWRAQWAISKLEEARADGLTSNMDEDVLDILLVTSNVTKILGA